MIAWATDPPHGRVALTGGTVGAHTGVTYTPDPNYCNTRPGNTVDRFRYTTDSGSNAEVFMTVTCVEDAAIAVADNGAVYEDAPATAVPVLENDIDGDGDSITIASATDPAHGSVALTGGVPGAHTGLTYRPDTNYCNNGSIEWADTFDYQVSGGSIATVTMFVGCVDDPPVALDDATSVAEDSPAVAVTVLANDTDVDGEPITIESVSDPAHGSVVLTGPGSARSGLSYAPDTNYCNDGRSPDSFTYTLRGGSTATVYVTVSCADDPLGTYPTRTEVRRGQLLSVAPVGVPRGVTLTLAGRLPAGLTFDAATGVIQGIPTGPPGTTTIEVVATTADGQHAILPVTITVLPALPTLALRFNRPGGRALTQNRRVRNGRYLLWVRAISPIVRGVIATITQITKLDATGRLIALRVPLTVGRSLRPVRVTTRSVPLRLRVFAPFTAGQYSITLMGRNSDGRAAAAAAIMTLRR
jgi:hypothetical protein